MKSILLFFTMLALAVGALFAQTNGYEVGDEAMSFELRNVDGELVSPADYPDAAGFIVVFTCNHCPFSVKYEDRIIALDAEFADRGYPVIAINPNDPEAYPEDDFANMQARAEEKGFTFPYLHDESQEVAATYGATRTPHTFVLQRTDDDRLVVRYIGAIDDNVPGTSVGTQYVKDAVNALIEGGEIPETYTRAVGCSIKWKS